MKKYIFIVMAIFLVSFSNDNQKIKSLETKSKKYIEQGNYAKAISALEEANRIKSEQRQPTRPATSRNVSQASRFVKLAQSYTNNGDYGKAFENLERAERLIGKNRNWEAQYWSAAIDEAYGVIYKKMNITDKASEHLKLALRKYQQLISMPGGSQDAVKILIANLENELSELPLISNNSVVLNFDNQKLRDLPANLPQQVENISVSSNRLRNFPQGISNFKQLKVLNLSNNSISEVKFDFGSIRQLRWLDLSNNKIKSLDESIGKASNLEYLDLSNNKLKTIPMSITNLKNLKVLNLKNNKLAFSSIKTILQSLPNTNVLHDEYLQKGEETE